MVRDALKIGLEVEAQFDINPFEYGLIGSTDTHNGTPGATQEDDYRGQASFDDDTPAKRLDIPRANEAWPPSLFNGGGLAEIWAEANTREAIFDALKRKETFATSGTRIRVRFFGSWDYPRDLSPRAEILERAYRDGVPMGGILPPSANARSPRFNGWFCIDKGDD